MPDWNKKFKAEYDYARSFLQNGAKFDKSWQDLVKRLGELMDPQGFNAGQAAALDDLRKYVKHGEKGLIGYKTATEDEGILRAVGQWDASGAGSVESLAKMRAAALKLLRHVYLLNRSGNRKVWLVNLPKAFNEWPSDDLNARAGTQIAARILLRSDDQIFSHEQSKQLATSAQTALAWCQKTTMVLAAAAQAVEGKGGAKAVAALQIVRRWFADPGTSITDLGTYIGKLSTGFKAIIATLGRGHLVLTDWVPLRTASTQDDLDFLGSEAFTFAGNGEGMDVVYIERAFFNDSYGNVLPPSKNWTRILVHELTHLVCNTEDVNIGQTRYAHYGIGPHAGFPGSAAIRNADSWAFFCTDCGGVLTDGERAHALKII